MIPQIIHYTWFSGEEMPQIIQDCISSWKEKLPNYKLRLWDMDSISNIDSIFLKEAIAERKWAYAADFVRLYAIYHEGGIYLDTDVMVFKNFDEFLCNSCFIGTEQSVHFDVVEGVRYLTSHCMGAVKGHVFFKHCLEYYEDRHFVISQNKHLPTLLRYNYVTIPYIQAVIALEYGYNWDPRINTIQRCNEGMVVYPTDYFCGEPEIRSSYCQHLTLGAWREHHSPYKSNYSGIRKIKFWVARYFHRFLLRHSRILVRIKYNGK